MKIMNLKERKEDAVSPVIGVMLMLVVTIVIAAVVAAFASGVVTDANPAPSVVLDADMFIKDNKNQLSLMSLSGERIKADQVSIKIMDSAGTVLQTTGLDLDTEPYFTPGMSKTISLTTSVQAGKYATVLVTYDNTHVLYKNDLLVMQQ